MVFAGCVVGYHGLRVSRPSLVSAGWLLVGIPSVTAPMLDFLQVIADTVRRVRSGVWKVPEGDAPRPINIEGWFRARALCPFCCLFGRKRNDTTFLNKAFDSGMEHSEGDSQN